MVFPTFFASHGQGINQVKLNLLLLNPSAESITSTCLIGTNHRYLVLNYYMTYREPICRLRRFTQAILPKGKTKLQPMTLLNRALSQNAGSLTCHFCFARIPLCFSSSWPPRRLQAEGRSWLRASKICASRACGRDDTGICALTLSHIWCSAWNCAVHLGFDSGNNCCRAPSWDLPSTVQAVILRTLWCIQTLKSTVYFYLDS